MAAVKPGALTQRAPSSASVRKREQILLAATRVFLEAGFEAASMDSIARAADVSKITIYNHFGSKDTLFAAIVERQCDLLLAPLLAGGVEGTRPEQVLREMGLRFLDMVRDVNLQMLYRLVIAETPKFPALGRLFYEAGPGRAAANLAQWLSHQHDAGRLNVPVPQYAAEQFFGMVCGHHHLRCLLLLDGGPDDAQSDAQVERAVADFMMITRTPGAQRSR